ncbi:MAG: SDR family oxidoreductase [Alphaproteobacteria bacterium]|nr:SDR family oxidoreductase [Alphaproteobacteria bacterium]
MAGRVLITGAAKRFGRAIALDLGKHGWDVALHYNTSEEEARQTEAEVRALGVKAALVKADLAREDEVASLVDRAGPLDALINNASIFEYDDWQSATRESWDRHMEINLRAPFVLSQALARQGGSAVVNIIDQRVLKPTPQFMTYSLSRAGLHWLTRTMAQALAPQVRVNAVAPGPSFIGARQDEASYARQRASTPLGLGASVEDLTGAVRYLLEAKSVTGEMIAVDGGQHLAWKTPDVLVQE